MYIDITHGKQDLYWWNIRDEDQKNAAGDDRVVAIGAAPGHRTHDEALAEAQRVSSWFRRPHGFAYHFWPLLFAVVALCTSAYVIADQTVGLN